GTLAGGHRPRPPLMLWPRQRAGQQRAGAALRERSNRAFSRRPAAEEPEYRRSAAGHRRGDRTELLELSLEARDLRVPPDDGRLEIVDHLRGADRPRDREQLQFADLPDSCGAIFVVPRIGCRGRYATWRTHDHQEV